MIKRFVCFNIVFIIMTCAMLCFFNITKSQELIISKAQGNAFSCQFTYRGKSWQFGEKELRSKFFYDKYKFYKDSNSGRLRDIQLIDTMLKMECSHEYATQYIFDNIAREISKINKKIGMPAKQAPVKFIPEYPSKFFIGSHRTGLEINKTELFREFVRQYRLSNTIKIELPMQELLPTITTQVAKTFTKHITSFSTSYETSSPARKNNIRLALSKFNKMKIEPQQVVSFNATTGRRTEEKGYQKANIILNEEFVEGVGGGVCQVSTTLYNALLLSNNVEVIESHRHSMPVSYVQLGFDSMVAFGSSDLKWKNVGDFPIFIHTYHNEEKIFVDIYGKPDNTYSKKRRTEIVSKVAPNKDRIITDTENKYFKLNDAPFAKRVKYAKDGLEVKTYLEYYKNNSKVNSVLLRHTTYPAQRGLIVYPSNDYKSLYNSLNNDN